jgi:dipeptidyl aminopeptidase/acylaminoacyl peptidase
MIARITTAGLVLAVLIGIGAGAAHAEVPPGPRLAYLRWDLYSGPEQVQLDSAAADGSAGELLAGGATSVVPLPDPYGGISWSPDGASLAFVSGGAPESTTYQPGSIYIVPAGGGLATEVAGSEGASNPVFAPDGRSLAVERTGTRTSPGDPRHHGSGGEVFEFSVCSGSKAASPAG